MRSRKTRMKLRSVLDWIVTLVPSLRLKNLESFCSSAQFVTVRQLPVLIYLKNCLKNCDFGVALVAGSRGSTRGSNRNPLAP